MGVTLLDKQDGNWLKSLNSSVHACSYFTSVPTSAISISVCEIDVRASTRKREMFLFLQVWTRLKVLTVRMSTRLLCQTCFSKRRETTNKFEKNNDGRYIFWYKSKRERCWSCDYEFRTDYENTTSKYQFALARRVTCKRIKRCDSKMKPAGVLVFAYEK